jgi:hypothetical protein
MHQACLDLQLRFTLVYDEEADKGAKRNNVIRIPGVRQLLEKKQVTSAFVDFF